MKQTLYVLLFQLIAINTVDAQVLKKIARGIKEGASGAFEFSKNTVSDAVEFGRIKSIYKDINEKKFDDAAVKLNDFKAKYPDNYVHKYLSYLLFNSEDYSSKNYDLAYASIDSLITYHYEFFDEKEKEKLCKEIMLCGPNLTKQNEIVQSKLLNIHRSSDSAISYFIEKYPKSYLIDSAINIRYTLRYETAKAVNNLEAYTEFIIQNPNSPQFNEARYNQSVLAFEKAQNENIISSYQYFLRNYSGIGLLDTKAKLALKNLKISEIYNGYQEIINKFGQLIRRYTFEFSESDRFHMREDGITPFSSKSSTFAYQTDKLAYTEFTVDGTTINSENLLGSFTKQLNNFISDYPHSKELFSINQIKDEITRLRERLDFYNVKERSTSSSDPLQKFIDTYPKSIYSIYAKNKKDTQTKIELKKQEISRIKEEKEALAQAKIKKEQERKAAEESNVIYQIAKRLSPQDKKLLFDIIDGKVLINDDPKSIAGKKCGIGYGNCKWCSTTVTYDKVYTTKAGIIRSFTFWGPGLLLFTTETQLAEYASEMKTYLQGIRSGNYYICAGNDNDLFCSLKCQNEYKYRR